MVVLLYEGRVITCAPATHQHTPCSQAPGRTRMRNSYAQRQARAGHTTGITRIERKVRQQIAAAVLSRLAFRLIPAPVEESDMFAEDQRAQRAGARTLPWAPKSPGIVGNTLQPDVTRTKISNFCKSHYTIPYYLRQACCPVFFFTKRD